MRDKRYTPSLENETETYIAYEGQERHIPSIEKKL
jgi:hypothetical protein